MNNIFNVKPSDQILIKRGIKLAIRDRCQYDIEHRPNAAIRLFYVFKLYICWLSSRRGDLRDWEQRIEVSNPYTWQCPSGTGRYDSETLCVGLGFWRNWWYDLVNDREIMGY